MVWSARSLGLTLLCSALVWLSLVFQPAGLGAAALDEEPLEGQDEHADEGDLGDEFELLAAEAVVELPARHRQSLGMSPSAVTVISRQDIETSGATTIPDLLRMVPGMDVIVTSRFLTAITSRLFWSDENNVYLVLVDGREANLELLGQAPWEVQPISLDDIERIEIIRGPGSALYGANALAGVVSITTRAVPERDSAYVHLLGGEGGVFGAYGRASRRHGGWGLSLSGGGDRAGRFEDPRLTTKRVIKARALGEYRWSESDRLLLDAGFAEGGGPVSSAVGAVSGSIRVMTLRLALESESLQAQLYWAWMPVEAELDTPLVYRGARLAKFLPATVDSHTLDGQVQYRLPSFWAPLLILAGAGARATWLGSDQLLDGASFADDQSPDYLQPGISHWEVRVGSYLHAELSPADWVTLTGGARYDFNTQTGSFVSPRLASVFQPVAGQYLRVGAARAFRKPAFVETGTHFDVTFPRGSPVADQDGYREFLSGVIGNPNLPDEELWAFELGYLGQFLDNRLQASLDLYYNLFLHQSVLRSISVDGVVPGLPDLERSSFRFEDTGADLDVFGFELALRFNLTRRIQLMANWAYREVVESATGQTSDTSPKHLIGVGGRVGTETGLFGSLYLFTRSEFVDRSVENAEGVFSGYTAQKMDNVALAFARLGWRLRFDSGLQAEAGLNLLLPIAPWSETPFQLREKGGYRLPDGRSGGGEEVTRAVSVYFQGSY